MKRIFRRNQMIITTLAVMIAAAGYLNYSVKKEVTGSDVYEVGMMEISDEDILAENQALHGVDDGTLKEIASFDGGESEEPADSMVSADGQSVNTGERGAGADGNTAGAATEDVVGNASGNMEGTASVNETAAAGVENPGEAVLTNGTSVAEYIAGVQLNREQIRAKNKETLMELINSEQIPDTEKQAAIQSMIAMTEIAEKENAAETLLQAKGFVDPVVSITDQRVDVVINAVSITDPERAQIEDIVKRKTEIGADGIVITLMDLME